MATKSILMSIRPQYVAKILNGEKTIEIRKKFPKDYVGWVYIYCTKDNKEGLHVAKDKWLCIKHNKVLRECCHNGKVVARFWCDKVELIKCGWRYEDCCNHYDTNEMNEKELLKYSCLSICELIDYLGYNGKTISNIVGYAIHISKLEVFERPKELKELMKPHTVSDIEKVECPKKKLGMCNWGMSIKRNFKWIGCNKFRLSKAPQSYMFIEDSTTI